MVAHITPNTDFKLFITIVYHSDDILKYIVWCIITRVFELNNIRVFE